MALSKNKIKWVRRFHQKKIRDQEDVFFAEGEKLVHDLWSYFECVWCGATKESLHHMPFLPSSFDVVDQKEHLQSVSLLKSTPSIIAIFKRPTLTPVKFESSKELFLALDGVQDPGNLGTIVRLADWYGIHDIFCSLDTVSVYNPKCVQSTMGALSRVRLHYVDLPKLISEARQVNYPIYGTSLEGEDMYKCPLKAYGILVMGNEGKGLSQEVNDLVNEKLYISSYPGDVPTSESLNVAVATGIICAEFRRRLL